MDGSRRSREARAAHGSEELLVARDPAVTDEEHEQRRDARGELLADAHAWGGSIYDWLYRARELPAAALLSSRELDAITRVVWGLGGAKIRLIQRRIPRASASSIAHSS